MDKNEVTEAVLEALEKRATIDGGKHKGHHEFIELSRPFIESFIRREKRKQERWETIKTKVLGWGIIGLLGAVGTAVYQVFFKNVTPPH